jgi:hypothetical protein
MVNKTATRNKSKNMKNSTLTLIVGTILTAAAFSSLATEPLLSPRAAGNQIKVVASATEAPVVTAAYADSHIAWRSPRAAGNEISAVKGMASESTPAAACRANMKGTPRAVAECGSHANMPGCMAVVSRN